MAGEINPARVSIEITSPKESDPPLRGKAPLPIKVEGDIKVLEGGLPEDTQLLVRLGNRGWQNVGQANHGPWSFEDSLTESDNGALGIFARVRGRFVQAAHGITVKVELDGPPDLRLSIDAPSALAGQAQTTYVPVRVDAKASSGIKRLSWRVNGEVVDSIGLSQADKDWSGVRNLPIPTPTSTTDYTIAVKCKDFSDAEENRETAVRISGVGEPVPSPAPPPRPNPPQYEIIIPREGMKFGSLDSSAVIRIRGTARNVLGVAKVEWSLDNDVSFQPASYDPASFVWWAEVQMRGEGNHRLNVRFTDGNGYNTTLVRNTGIKKPTKYESLEQMIDPQAYLQDLLAYANAHVLAPDKPLETTMLNAVFHQSFDELAKPPEKPDVTIPEKPKNKPVLTPGNQPINQVRLTVEVLRKYFERQWQVLAPAGAQAALLAGSELRGLIAAAPPKSGILAKAKRIAGDVRAPTASAAEAGLSAHWQFDEGKGLVAADVSGNENELTLLAAQWATGRTRGALFFNGASALALRKSPASLYMGKTMSACAWIYPQGPGTEPEGGIIFIKEGEYALARLGNGRVQWIFANVNPGWQWVDTGYVARENEWTHVAVVYNNGSVATYANGQPVHNFTGAGAIGNVDDRIDQICLGGRAWSSQHFHGLMDDVRIYRRALGPEEVVTLAL